MSFYEPIELLWGVNNHRLKGFFQDGQRRRRNWMIPFQVNQYRRFLGCLRVSRCLIVGQNQVCGIAVVRGDGAEARSSGRHYLFKDVKGPFSGGSVANARYQPPERRRS